MKSKTQRPNILLITSDQHRDDGFGFEGRKLRTPHIDTMARDGTRMATPQHCHSERWLFAGGARQGGGDARWQQMT